MVEITPMLRVLMNALAARPTPLASVAPLRVVGGTDKLDRRRRQRDSERRYLKSVCTSLRDICEM